jgi:hypothetical protein
MPERLSPASMSLVSTGERGGQGERGGRRRVVRDKGRATYQRANLGREWERTFKEVAKKKS